MRSRAEENNPKVLILGGTGMLGHKLWQSLRGACETYATARGDYHSYERYGDLFPQDRFLTGVNAFDFDSVERAFAAVRPSAVVNCIGIVKQAAESRDPVSALTVNALFPHRLAALCRASGTRVVHISTDCVFAGGGSNYSEDSVPDAEDLYGRTKFLGEVSGPHCLTLRTSIIGRELATSHGLVEWFLGREEQTRGYRRAIFSGLTTHALSRAVRNVLMKFPELSGVFHVSSEPINKFDLISLLQVAYDTKVPIEPCDQVQVDRSLDGARFRDATGFETSSWADMIQAMAADKTPYREWRR